MKIRKYNNNDYEQIIKIYNLSKSDEFCQETEKFNVIPLEEDAQMLTLFNESNIYV